jgi:cell division transport system permease protein
MNLRRLDLPLDQTSVSRFLPWTIAGLVYLAVLALAVAAVADGALRIYNLRAKIVTVTLPSVEDTARSAEQLKAALDVLRRTRGVTAATPVSPENLKKLIEPWLGNIKEASDLPLPQLIDVSLDPIAKPDLAALQDKLQRIVAPGATVGIEALSRDRAERMAAFFRIWASGAGILTLIGVLLAVGLITRISLRVQIPIVELLRSMGAPDSYLARQFERYALLCGLRGGLLGFALAVITIVGLLYSSRRMQLAGSIQLGLSPLDWVLLACVPLVSALLVMAIARMTAMRGLAHMP